MTYEIAEIEKAASLLRAVADDYNATVRDRGTCYSAALILTKIALKLRQESPLYAPDAKFKGPRILKIIKNQEVA